MKKYKYSKDNPILKKRLKKGAGVFSILLGIGTLFYFFFPIFSYNVFLSSAFAGGTIEAPLPKRFVLGGGNVIGDLFSAGIANVTGNYKDARNWFPQIHDTQGKDADITQYELSIPSQGIDKAKVVATDYDLSQHLVQYFSTSKNPIDKGTSVIFGHSTLPQWFDPKNYMAIFAKLHTIKNGDEIDVTVNGMLFKYKIFSITVMNPTDPNIFTQSFDNSYITLVTCTPPGTTWKRLVVRAALDSL